MRPVHPLPLVAVVLATACCVLLPATARAQRGTTMGIQMPAIDLSSAPKDIQAIWKKLQSGGTPTPAEAQRLAQWMQSHASEIQRSATEQAEGAGRAASATAHGASGLASGSGSEAACPARSPMLARLGAAAPTRSSAQALLDFVRTAYGSLEKATTVRGLQKALARETVPALRQRGAASLLAGFDAVTVLAYAEAASRATAAEAQDAWGDLGAALVELRDPAHAVPVLRYALSLGPRSPLLVHNLGVAYADLGGLDSAASLLTEVTRAAPGFAGSYDALARVESCAGNMTVAWRALAKAQEVDWNSDRERKIDEHESSASESASDDDDASDAAEAAKPFPEPHAPSAFPPPLAAHAASSFQPATPALPDKWRDAVARKEFYLSQANQYAAAASAALSRGMHDQSGARAEDAIEAQVASAAAHGMHITVVSFSNGKEATDAADIVTRRAGARMSMIERDFGERMIQIAKDEPARRAPLDEKLSSCKKANPAAPPETCMRPYCKALNALWDQSYTEARSAGRVAIGGLSGIPAELHRVLMAWFIWAGDPAARAEIDATRIHWLSLIQQHAFVVAERVADYASSNRGTLCDQGADADWDGPEDLRTGSPADRGSCKEESLDLEVIKVEKDCEKYVLELIPLIVDGVPEGKIEYHAATADRNGTLFMGFSASAGPKDVLEGHVGVGLTFDQSGMVQAAGPALGGTVGIDALSGHVSGTGLINLRDDGPAVTGWGEAAAPSWAAAPHFGGKL